MKYFSATIPLCFLFLSASSQTFWETYEDSGFIYNSSVLLLSSDAAGNIYSYGTQPPELYPTGFYLDKKDESGNVLWKLDVSYSVILFMQSTQTGITFLLSEVTVGAEAAWLDKEYTIYAYDTDGDIIWQKLLSMPLYEFESMKEESMAVDKAGNISVAVHVFNEDPEPGHDGEIEDAQLYIAKFKGINGALLKQTLQDVTPFDLDETPVEFLRVDTKGNIYLYIVNFDDVDYTMYKYNTLLEQVWVTEMGNYLPRKILVHKNKFLFLIHEITEAFVFDSIEVKKYDAVTGNNIYVSQTTALLFSGISSHLNIVYSTLDKAGNPIIPYTYSEGPIVLPCLLKLDGSDGSAAFHIQISTTASGDEVNGYETNRIGIGPLNEVIIGGMVEISSDVLTPICFKYSKTGVKIWEHAVLEEPFNHDKEIRSYTFTGTSHLVMGGQFSTPDFYNARYTVSFDGNLTERLPSQEITTEQRDNSALFPNPAAEYIQLQNVADVRIKKIFTYTTEGKRMTLNFDETLKADIKHLPAGMYISMIITEEGDKITEKWVKQ